MENEKITIVKNGKEIECDVLFTFDCEETSKAYIGYTDHTIAPNGRKNIYVSAFDPILGFGSLQDITTEEEMTMVREVLEEIDAQSDK